MGATNTLATNFTVANAPTPETYLSGALWGGKIHCQIDYKDMAGIEADSTVKIGRMPKGAIVIGCILRHAAGTGATTGTIGDAGAAARFGTFTSTAADGTQVLATTPNSATTASITTGMGYVYTADTDIFITTAAATITAGIWATCLIYATID